MKQQIKVGILLTDHVLKDLQVKHGDQPDFYNYIFHLADPSVSLCTYDIVDNKYPKNINDCSGYLITGSKLSVYDDLGWIKRLKKFILKLHENRKPLIGVCFGHQLISDALGGKTEVAKKGWTVGNQEYNFKAHFPWIKEPTKPIKLLHSHKDQITKLPEEAELIASTEKVPIGMYRVGTHIMCHQGHPEFTSDYVMDVATKRRNILGEEKYQEAVQSLTREIPNSVEVAKWWIDFFRFNT